MIGKYEKGTKHEDIFKSDAILMRQQFSAALREAKIAASELYTSYGTPGLEYIDEYGKAVIEKLKEIHLPKCFTPEDFKRGINKINLIMDRANNSFNWDDPNLDKILEPADWNKPDMIYKKGGAVA